MDEPSLPQLSGSFGSQVDGLLELGMLVNSHGQTKRQNVGVGVPTTPCAKQVVGQLECT